MDPVSLIQEEMERNVFKQNAFEKAPFQPFDYVIAHPMIDVIHEDGTCGKINAHELEKMEKLGWKACDPKADKKE